MRGAMAFSIVAFACLAVGASGQVSPISAAPADIIFINGKLWMVDASLLWLTHRLIGQGG